MKKTIIILLALVMVLSLAACGGGSTATNTPAATEAPTPEPTPEPTEDVLNKNDVANYLGVWQVGKSTLTFNKGGIGRYEPNMQGYGFYDFTYEVKDEVVVISYSDMLGSFPSSLELNDDGSALEIIQFNFVRPSDATEFSKVE